MQLARIIDIIEKKAPLPVASPWDKSGVQVAASDKNISHAALMLDPTLSSIQAAVDAGCDFIISHHPLSMKARFPDNTGPYHSILSLLFRNDICLYSAHTSLDASPYGTAKWLAESLHLSGVTILEPTGEYQGEPVGFGFVGDLPQALSYNEFCTTLASAMEKDSWRACGPKPERIRRVACCPGSGADMFTEAAVAGADIYITGDMKYHAALDTSLAGIRVLDVGHFQLEEIMMRRFAEMLADELGDVKVIFLPSSDPLVFEKY